MPSSTSSSEPRRWGRAWLGALLLALAALGAWEGYWRSRGISPGLIDSRQAWAIQRDRVYDARLRPVVFLGASRTVYGLDPKVWKSQRPVDKPVMLGVNGHYPLAALRDLALDDDFSGLVVCDIDSYGLLPMHHEMQQPWVEYHQRSWNANWHGHRVLLNAWQRRSVLANPGVGLWATLKRLFTGGGFGPGYSESDSNRAGEMRFERANVAALAAHFDRGVDAKIAGQPPPTPAEFIEALAPMHGWIEALRDRGGDVVFVQLPVRGRLVELESRYLTRPDYWDAFAALPGVRALHYEDVPEWSTLVLPDHSHVRREDRANLTLGLIAALERRGWLD